MHENKFFTPVQINDHVLAICGYCSEVCYLVEGEDRALLIDGLTGVGSLMAYVRELTDKPVQLVLTHGHLDHVGAAFEYGKCYIHPDDIALMYTDHHSSVEQRFGFALSPQYSGIERRTEPNIHDVIPSCPVITYPVYDGDVFDLGGLEIEVIHVPGHTRGSIVLLDRADRILFSGDAININTLCALEGSASIVEYKAALEHLLTFVPAFDGMLGGHGPRLVPTGMIAEGIKLCDQIISRTDDKVERESVGRVMLYASGLDFMELVKRGMPNIAYREDNIQKSARPKITDGPII